MSEAAHLAAFAWQRPVERLDVIAPVAIGLSLTLIHLISIPVTNTSVNPARSTGVALFVGDWAVSQLWLFWAAPLVGALVGVVAYKVIATNQD